MKRLLLPLLAALALPTAVNATNYLECEAIYQVLSRSAKVLMNTPSGPAFKDLFDKQEKIYIRAQKDAKKRGCYYIDSVDPFFFK